MEKQVHDFIDRHQLFHDDATILVGVSGGPDSMALLHFLKDMRVERGYHIIALAVDHGLRGEESTQDIEYVEKMCEWWGIKCISTFVNVPLYKKEEKKGTQVAARELRYKFFEQQMEALGADYLALAHHGDDQAETMFMRLIRNAEPAALQGIPIKREFVQGYLVRPFLCISKDDIEVYCHKHHIEPRRDPSNDEDVYTRNFLRLHVMPLLQQKNPVLHKNLQRLSESITQDESYLNQEAQKLLEKVATMDDDKKQVRFTVRDFIHYPFALQRRSFHLILNYLYQTIPKGLHYAHEDHFFSLIHSHRPNASIDLPSGLKIHKMYEMIQFDFASTSVMGYLHYLNVPGRIDLPNGDYMTAFITSNPSPQSKFVFNFPINGDRSVCGPLIVRTRRSGDKMKVKGLNGTKKVKDIFIDKKVPLSERDAWPIVTDQTGNIVWVVGLNKGIVDTCLESQSFLELQYIKDEI